MAKPPPMRDELRSRPSAYRCVLIIYMPMWRLLSRFETRSSDRLVRLTLPVIRTRLLTVMTTTPLSSNDYGKLFVFGLLILPPTALVVGIVPFLLLAFGLFMFRKTKDFAHVETAARHYRIYCLLFVVGFVVAALYNATQMATDWERESRIANTIACSICAAVGVLYIVALNYLFLYPLRYHREWIEQNGIFSSRNKAEPVDADRGAIDIIKGERLRSFSVADELLKWAKLKEDGHISEQEFNEARAKLLQKS